MTTQSLSEPEFLKRSLRIDKQPSFLERGQIVSAPEESYMTDEEFENEILRQQAQQHHRAFEAILGLPGDLINFVGGLFGFEPNAPGSEKLKELSSVLTKGYTDPQNEFEEIIGETVQDISLFALPGSKYYSTAKNIGIPVVSNLLKEGLKYAGADEKQQASGKIGAMVLLELIARRSLSGNAKDYALSLFKKADEAIPAGLSIKATNIKDNLNTLKHSLTRGGSRPDTSEALQKIDEILKEIKPNGFIDLKDLISYRPSINSWIDKFKGFEIDVPPKIRSNIINNLNKVKKQVINAAEEYGEKYNPEFLELSKSANEAYAAVEQTNKIANFIQKKAGSKIQSSLLKSLLGLTATGVIGGTTGLFGLGLGTTVGIGVGAGYKALKTILRSKSPTLRNHYFKIIEGAAKQNTPQVLHNIKFLDNALLEMEKTGELDFIDQE